MSLQYGVASAVLYGRVDEETYVRFDDPELLRLIASSRIEVVPAYAASLQKLMQPACVEIRLRDGSVHEASVQDVPWLSDPAVVARFRREAEPFLKPDQQTRLVELVNELWSLESCAPLFELFAEARTSRSCC